MGGSAAFLGDRDPLRIRSKLVMVELVVWRDNLLLNWGIKKLGDKMFWLIR